MLRNHLSLCLILTMFFVGVNYLNPTRVLAADAVSPGSDGDSEKALLAELQQNTDEKKIVIEKNLPDLKLNIQDNENEIKKLKDKTASDRAKAEADVDALRDENGKFSDENLVEVKKIEKAEKSQEKIDSKPLINTKKRLAKAEKTLVARVGELDRRDQLIKLKLTERACRKFLAQGTRDRLSQTRILCKEANLDHFVVQQRHSPGN